MYAYICYILTRVTALDKAFMIYNNTRIYAYVLYKNTRMYAYTYLLPPRASNRF